MKSYNHSTLEWLEREYGPWFERVKYGHAHFLKVYKLRHVDPYLAAPFIYVSDYYTPKFSSSLDYVQHREIPKDGTPKQQPLPMVLFIIPEAFHEDVFTDLLAFENFLSALSMYFISPLIPVAEEDSSIPPFSVMNPFIYNHTGHLGFSFGEYDYDNLLLLISRGYPDEKRVTLDYKIPPSKGVDTLPIDFFIPSRYDDEDGVIVTYCVRTCNDPARVIKQRFGDSIEVLKSAIVSAPVVNPPKSHTDTKFIAIRHVKDYSPETLKLFSSEFTIGLDRFRIIESFGERFACKFCRAPYHSRPECDVAPKCKNCGSRAHAHFLCPNASSAHTKDELQLGFF